MIKDLTHGLKKITFINHKRFSYGEVDVSGNTLLTGDNGAGKSTTIQAGLFFYGSTTNSELNIITSDGKSNWMVYAYPDINSYVFYEYQGVHGRILLITYRTGNAGTKIGYRFVMLEKPLDIAELVFDENNVSVEPDIIKQRLVEMGFKPSKQIDSPQQYRRILHGDATTKKDHSFAEFTSYSLFESKGDYQLLHSVQSSIFKNARVESGTVENAIASSFGNDYAIDLKQIRGQIAAVISDCDEVGKYDAKRGDFYKLFDAQREYRKENERLLLGIAQMLVNSRKNEVSLVSVKEEHNTILIGKDTFYSDYDKQLEELKKRRDDAYEKKITAKNNCDSLKEKAKRYDGFDMSSLSAKLDAVPALELEKSKLKDAYDDFIGEKKGIDEIYSKRIENAKATAREKRIAASEALNMTNEKFNAKIDTIKKELELQLSEINKKKDNELKEVLEKIETTSKKERLLDIELAELRVKNPYDTKVLEFDTTLKAMEKEIKERESEEKDLSVNLDTMNEKIKSYREKQELIQKSKHELLSSKQSPLISEIEKLYDILHADESTLLHFIREKMPNREDMLTSLLKDDVLMDNDLEPHLEEDCNTLFGLVINVARLPASDLSKSSIKAKIADIEKRMEYFRTELDESKREELESCTNGIIFYESEIYKTKEQSCAVEARLLELASKKAALMLVMAKEEETANIQWEKRKAEVMSGANQLIVYLNTLKSDKETIETLFNTKHNIYRQDYDNSLSLVQKDKELAKSEFDSLGKSIDSTLSSEIKTLESELIDALKKDGLDEQKITELQKQFENAKSILEDAKANKDLVLRWRDEKIELDKFPELNEKVKTTNQTFLLADELQKRETERINNEKKAYQDKLNGLARKVEDLNKELKGAETVLSNYSQYRVIAENMALGVSPDEQIVEIISNYLVSAENKMHKSIEFIAIEIQKFTAKLAADKVWFEYSLNTMEDRMRSIDNLRFFVEGGGLDAIKSTLTEDIRAIQSNSKLQFKSLSRESGQIESVMNKMRKRLKDSIEHIRVIDEIDLRYRQSPHKILKLFEGIRDTDLIYDTSSLFVDKNKQNENTSKVLKLFGELSEVIEQEHTGSLSIADTFEVDLKVMENGEDSGWIVSRNKIGSEGTSRMIKTLLYIILLDTAFSMTRKASHAPIHVFVDEIGTISKKNISSIINFANDCGIMFINAAPDIKAASAFDKIFQYSFLDGRTKYKSKIEMMVTRR